MTNFNYLLKGDSSHSQKVVRDFHHLLQEDPSPQSNWGETSMKQKETWDNLAQSSGGRNSWHQPEFPLTMVITDNLSNNNPPHAIDVDLSMDEENLSNEQCQQTLESPQNDPIGDAQDVQRKKGGLSGSIHNRNTRREYHTSCSPNASREQSSSFLRELLWANQVGQANDDWNQAARAAVVPHPWDASQSPESLVVLKKIAVDDFQQITCLGQIMEGNLPPIARVPKHEIGRPIST